MRIRKVFEDEQMSTESVQDIIDKITSMSSDINKNLEEISSIKNSLSNFKSKNRKSNNQIDDSISNIEISDSKMKDTLDLLDTIVSNLKDYIESGERYLYS